MKPPIYQTLCAASVALLTAVALSSCKEQKAPAADKETTASAPTAPAPAPPAPAPAVVLYYSVEITDPGPNKINAIKALRKLKAGMRLKDAKTAIESPPVLLSERATIDEANAIKADFEAAGCAVTLKQLDE